MYPVIEAGGIAYDAVCPSDFMIQKMREHDLLAEINFDNVPNIDQIDPLYMELSKSFDPENKYAVPYTWGTVGLIYNYDMLGFDPDSWDVMWDPNFAKQILQFSNSKDAFAIALMRLGYSINTEDQMELDQAAQLLKEQKPLVQAYVMDQIFDKMQGNEAAIAPYYAGDAINMLSLIHI